MSALLESVLSRSRDKDRRSQYAVILKILESAFKHMKVPGDEVADQRNSQGG